MSTPFVQITVMSDEVKNLDADAIAKLVYDRLREAGATFCASAFRDPAWRLVFMEHADSRTYFWAESAHAMDNAMNDPNTWVTLNTEIPDRYKRTQ